MGPNDLEALLSLPAILSPHVSNGRDRVAFLWNPTRRIELYDLELEGGVPRPVTDGTLPKSPRTSILWSPDDRSLLLAIDSDGNELHDLVEFDRATGVAKHLTSDPTCQRWPVEYSPDGRWVLYGSDRSAPGERRQLDLWRVSRETGEETRLSHRRQPAYPWYARRTISPDGQRLAYAASDSENARDLAVFIARADGGEARAVVSVREGSKEQPVGWSPNGRQLAFCSDAFDRLRTGIFDATTEDVRWLGHGTGDDVPIEFSPDANVLLLIRTDGVRSQPVLVDLTTGVETLVPIATSVYAESALLGNGRGVVSIRQSTDRPDEIVSWERGGAVRVHLGPRWGSVDPRALRPAKVVRYPSFDGRTIEALLYEPADRAPGSRRPALVEAHGGPTWQFSADFDPRMQYLASQGWAVLLPNVRGSTGYGITFRDLNLRDLGGGDLRDLAAGVDFLRGLGYVDPHRIGLEGGSYGGFLTYLALTKMPDLFCAGCALAGVSDWPLCYAEEAPALQQLDRELLGDPEENRALWADRSAVNFADQIRAPIFMIHGVNDSRCPVSQARVFRDALVRAGRVEGRDFEYLEFSDEGHGSYDVADMLRTYGPMVEFFRRRFEALATPGG